MALAPKTSVAWAIATIVLGGAGTGCGGPDKAPAQSSSSASASSAASSTGSTAAGGPSMVGSSDYSALLMKPSDVGGDFNPSQPPVLNPDGADGVEVLFVNPDNTRRIGDTISILADPAAAAARLDGVRNDYLSRVSGTWQPAEVGSNGSMISGTTPDNSQALTVLLFTEGKALVKLEFAGAANDPIDAAVATDIGRKQDTAVKNGLRS